MKILDVRVDFVGMNGAIEKAFTLDGGCIFTPNAVMIDRARGDLEFRKILNSASLNLPDSSGVTLAARVLYGRKAEKVSGVDFGLALMRECVKRGEGVFLLGGKSGVALCAAENLRKKIDGLKIVGTCDGFSELSGAAERIRDSGARFALICLGSPMQEKWAKENMGKCPNCVFIGLGGSIDVYAGRVRRAPKALSAIGLEWAWRMMLQPKRLKNLPALFRFFFSVFVQRRSKRRKSREKSRKIKQN